MTQFLNLPSREVGNLSSVSHCTSCLESTVQFSFKDCTAYKWNIARIENWLLSADVEYDGTGEDLVGDDDEGGGRPYRSGHRPLTLNIVSIFSYVIKIQCPGGFWVEVFVGWVEWHFYFISDVRTIFEEWKLQHCSWMLVQESSIKKWAISMLVWINCCSVNSSSSLHSRYWGLIWWRQHSAAQPNTFWRLRCKNMTTLKCCTADMVLLTKLNYNNNWLVTWWFSYSEAIIRQPGKNQGRAVCIDGLVMKGARVSTVSSLQDSELVSIIRKIGFSSKQELLIKTKANTHEGEIGPTCWSCCLFARVFERKSINFSGSTIASLVLSKAMNNICNYCPYN